MSGEAPLPGATIQFRFNGTLVGSAATDVTGTATLPATLSGVARGSYAGGVTASFADDGVFAAASASAMLEVLGQAQTIAFGPLADKSYLDPPFELTAIATSGLPVSFSVSGPCTITGAMVTLTAAGACAVTASQAGDATWDPAPDTIATFSIAALSQSISFDQVYGRPYDSGPVTLSATASSGLTVDFSILSGPATITGNVLTMTGIGTITVRASQAGDGGYAAAAPVDRTFGALGLPVATALSPSNGPITGGMEVSVSGDGLSTTSHLLVNGVGVGATYVSNALVKFIMPPGAAGPVNVQADVQCYAGAPGATACGVTAPLHFTYEKHTQAISFDQLFGRRFDDAAFTVVATATSGLPVSFAASGVCAASGDTITLSGTPGTCIVTASQTGDASYDAAAPVARSFAALPRPVATSLSPDHGPLAGGMEVSLSGSGLGTTYGLQVNGAPVAASVESDVLVKFVLPAGGAGAVDVVAFTACGPLDLPTSCGASNPVTFTYDRKPQTITFDELTGKTFGNPAFAVSASSDSGLPVSVSIVSGPALAAGSLITITGVGAVTVRASQTGDATWLPAADVEQSFSISRAASVTTVSCPTLVTYSVAAQTPCTVSVTGPGGLSLSPSATYLNNVNAGTASASYSFAGDANHEPSSDSTTFAIGTAAATVEVHGYAGTYDGAAYGATGTATGVNGEDLSAGLDLGATFTDAPGGKAQWTFSGGANYADQSGEAAITIGKAASVTMVAIASGSLTYTGAAVTPATVTVTGAGGLNLTPAAVYADNVHAGTATASYTFAGDANHQPSSGSATFAIDKATATIVVNGFTGVYDGAAHGATGSAIGVGGEDLSANLTLGATFSNAPGGTAHWSFSGSNYLDQNGSAAISIAKATLTVSADSLVKPAGAAMPALTASYSGFVNGDTPASLDAGVVLATTATATSPAGSYPITVTGGADANYSITRVNGVLTITPSANTTDVRLAIQRARAGIAAMLPSGDRATDRRLREALERIDQALAPWLWTDQSHLTVFGGMVFQQIKQAIDRIADHKTGRPLPVALDLVDALRDLADEALEDAIDDGAPALLIRKATRDLELGDEALDGGKLDGAIERYRQAWAVAELLPRLKHHDRNRRRFDRGRTDRDRDERRR